MINKIKFLGGFMKKILFLFLLATLAFADNPRIYSALGNVIYDNVDKIAKLKEIKPYYAFVLKIDKYVLDVKKAKQLGFDVQSGYKSKERKNYLNKLRELSKTNDFFIRSAKSTFKSSIDDEESEIFSKIINSGLIDTLRYKNEIKAYYIAHYREMNTSGVIQKFLDEDELLRKQREAAKRVKGPSKAELQKAKIARIRQKDKEQQKAVEKSLEEEVKRKKTEIIEHQKKELAN